MGELTAGWSVTVAVIITVALVVSMAVTVAVDVGHIGFSGTIDNRREIQWSAARRMLRNSMFVLRRPRVLIFTAILSWLVLCEQTLYCDVVVCV